ncbi:MAG: hypothetical protein AAF654_14425 [Myxococcota bacterium]
MSSKSLSRARRRTIQAQLKTAALFVVRSKLADTPAKKLARLGTALEMLDAAVKGIEQLESSGSGN